jgi:hypothetical protein
LFWEVHYEDEAFFENCFQEMQHYDPALGSDAVEPLWRVLASLISTSADYVIHLGQSSEMNTLEITVQRREGNGWPVVVEQSGSGVFLPVRHEGLLQVDIEFKTQLLQSILPKEYGTLLGQAVFRGEVCAAFVQALAKSDDRLHVLLSVEDVELRSLRWELLCAPLDGRWGFLALDQRLPFSLYVPSATDRCFPPIGRRDLRALVVVANPQGLDKYALPPFDAPAAIAGVRAALGEIPCDVLVSGEEAVGPPTLDALCERTRRSSWCGSWSSCTNRRPSSRQASPVGLPHRGSPWQSRLASSTNT